MVEAIKETKEFFVSAIQINTTGLFSDGQKLPSHSFNVKYSFRVVVFFLGSEIKISRSKLSQPLQLLTIYFQTQIFFLPGPEFEYWSLESG